MTDTYRVLIRAADRSYVAEVKDYVKLETISRLNRIGSATLTLDAGSPVRSYLEADQAGIVLLRNGQCLFSGPILSRSVKVAQHRGTLTINVASDLWYLSRRLSFPEAPALTTATKAFDDRQGTFTEVVRQLVHYNCGQGADATRQVTGLVTGSAFGSVVSDTVSTWKATVFANLLEVCQACAQKIYAATGIEPCFDVRDSGSGSLLLYVYGSTLSGATYSFAALNMFGYERIDGVDAGNFVVCGGDGAKTSRIYHFQTASTPQVDRWGRGEWFESVYVEKDSLPDTSLNAILTAMEVEAQRLLHEHVNHVDVSASLIDQDPSPFRRGGGGSYDVGDRVTVVVEGQSYVRQVREVKVTLKGPEDVMVEPMIGSSQTSRSR